MSCKEKNIDRSGYVLCPECKEGKFTFQDMPMDRVYFDSCPICRKMMSVRFDEYRPFVKLMGEGIPVPESKKCEEKGCSKCPSFHTDEKPVCPCKCHLTETHTVEPEENGIPESTPYLIDKRYLDELIEEMKPECDCICHGPIAGDKSCAVSCKHCVEPDYYTREEIDEKMKKIIKIMDGRETIASGCNEIVYVDKADEKAFRAEILSALRGIITDTIPKKAIPAWHGAIESLKSKFL